MNKSGQTPPPLPGGQKRKKGSKTIAVIIAAILLLAGIAVAVILLLKPFDRHDDDDDDDYDDYKEYADTTALLPAEEELAIVAEEPVEEVVDSIGPVYNEFSGEPEGALSYEGYMAVSGDRYPISLSFSKNGSDISSAKYRNLSLNVGFSMTQKYESEEGWYRLEGFDSNDTFTLRFHFNADGTATGTATLGSRSADLYLAPRN